MVWFHLKRVSCYIWVLSFLLSYSEYLLTYVENSLPKKCTRYTGGSLSWDWYKPLDTKLNRWLDFLISVDDVISSLSSSQQFCVTPFINVHRDLPCYCSYYVNYNTDAHIVTHKYTQEVVGGVLSHHLHEGSYQEISSKLSRKSGNLLKPNQYDVHCYPIMHHDYRL